MAAGLNPEDMKIVRLQDQQLNMTLEIPVIPGLFAAMGDGQGGEGFVISEDPLFKYDNHQIHYEMHRRFIMDSEFRFLHPEIQAAFMVHADYHKWVMEMEAAPQQQAAMEQAAEMEARKAALKPGPGEPPPEEAAGPGGNGGMPPEGPISIGPTDGYQPGTYPG